MYSHYAKCILSTTISLYFLYLGRPSNDPTHPDYVPTLQLGNNKRVYPQEECTSRYERSTKRRKIKEEKEERQETEQAASALLFLSTQHGKYVDQGRYTF